MKIFEFSAFNGWIVEFDPKVVVVKDSDGTSVLLLKNYSESAASEE